MRRKVAFIVFLALLLFVTVYSMVKEPHSFSQNECSHCHAEDRTGKILGFRLAAPAIVLCKKCHEKVYSEGYLHPVNVAPQKAVVPKDMPLSKDGEITCTTCHDVHSSYYTPYGTPSHYLRRYEKGRKFCEVCHRESSHNSHKKSLGEAHFNSKYIVTSPSIAIDSISKNCISCHDGSFSGSAMVKAGTWMHQSDFIKFDKGAHPIGIDYEKARMRQGRKTDLRPLAMVDKRIKLFEGKIGCGSCHDPYSTIEKRLIMSDRGSNLCFSCHLMN